MKFFFSLLLLIILLIFGVFILFLRFLYPIVSPTPLGIIKPSPLPDYLPDSHLTPGAINLKITQANIKQNICNPQWSTKSIRPPASYTTKLKIQQLTDEGLYGIVKLSDYEEDHLISLELGGHPTDAKNLWPEPYDISNGAHEKDKIENLLHKEVCNGTRTLKDAQECIAKDWTKCK